MLMKMGYKIGSPNSDSQYKSHYSQTSTLGHTTTL